jgi:hypothetical protein
MDTVKLLIDHWRSHAADKLRDQYARLWTTMAGIDHLVQISHTDMGNQDWHDSCFRCLPKGPSVILTLHKQHLVGRNMTDDPDHVAFDWNLWQPLGCITKVLTTTDGIPEEELNRLDMWYHRAFQPAPPSNRYHTLPHSTNAAKITSYFPRDTAATPLEYPKSVMEEDLQPTTSLWSGFSQ